MRVIFGITDLAHLLGAFPPDGWITQETKLKIRRLIGERRLGKKARRCSYRIFVSSCHSYLTCLGLFLSWQLALVIRAIALNLVRDYGTGLLQILFWTGQCPLHLRYLTKFSFLTLPICEKSVRIWGLPKSAWWRYGKHFCLYSNLFISTLLGEPQ